MASHSPPSPPVPPERPSFLDMAVLVGMQLGISAVAAGIVSFLPLKGSQSWVGAVGTISGALAFALWKEKRVPGFVAPRTHRLSLAAALLQTQVAAALCLLVLLGDDELRASLERVGSGGIAFAVAAGLLIVCGVLVYACTRFGLRMGVKSLEAKKNRSGG